MEPQITRCLLGVALWTVAAAAGAQQPMRPYRVERSKVPAVSHAHYTEPEAAPEPFETERKRQQAPRTSKSGVRQAAHYMDESFDGPSASMPIEPFAMGPHPTAGCDGPGCMQPCCAPCCPDACHSVWENLQVFGGVQGFKSEVDQGLNGNFGFHEGANWGGALFEYGGIGAQFGAQVVQSDLAESVAFEDNRIQFFLTTGLFHRPFDHDGWQGGVVFDWLHDDYYVQMDVAQIRGELSHLFCGHHELGAWVALGTTSDTKFSPIDEDLVSWEPIHMYSLFYRRHFENGGAGRFSAGFTGEGQGLLGADVLAPLTHCCALVANANYIIGRNDPAPEEALTEAWGLTISLVWYPGYKSCCSPRNPYRPIFDVVDNTTMMLKFRGPEGD